MTTVTLPHPIPADLVLDAFIKRTDSHYFAFGERADVWKAEWRDKTNKEALAIKVLRGGSSTNRQLINEIQTNLGGKGPTWKTLNHPNISVFYGFALDCGFMPALVVPYYKNGNIMEYLKMKSEKTEEDKLELIRQVANGLMYLHKQGIVHGDIRGVNIMISDQGTALLYDYGLAAIIDSTQFTSSKTAGTCRWAAPEIMNPNENEDGEEESVLFTTSSDIYAFGMTIIEIFSGDVPYSNKKNDSSVIFAVLANKKPKLPPYIQTNDEVRAIVEKCYDNDPTKRPTAKVLVEGLDIFAPKAPLDTHPPGRASRGWFATILSLFFGSRT